MNQFHKKKEHLHLYSKMWHTSEPVPQKGTSSFMQQNVAYKRTSSTKRRPNIFIYTAKRGTQANQFYKNKYKNDKSCAFKIVKGLKNENKDISSEKCLPNDGRFLALNNTDKAKSFKVHHE